MEEKDALKLYAKINEIRITLGEELTKSGKNDYAKFKYFQLDDFMPKALKLFNDRGIFTKFYIEKVKQELPTKREVRTLDDGHTSTTTLENFEYVDYGVLEVVDLDTGYTERFVKESVKATVSGASAIQNVGATNTYMKRYMYMDLLEIVEQDQVDGDTKQNVSTPVAPQKPATKSVKVKPVEVKAEAPAVDPAKENAPIVTNQSDALSIASKQELVNICVSKGLDPKSALMSACSEIGKEMDKLLESDKESLVKILSK